MKIHEYQARLILADAGLPVPPSRLALTGDQAALIAQDIGRPVVVKAQVLAGGRGKAGGVIVAENPSDARAAAQKILSLSIGGYEVEKVLIAEALDIQREIYLGAIVDRHLRQILVMASPDGGVEIEEIARTNESAILKEYVHPSGLFEPHEARRLGFTLELDRPQVDQFVRLSIGLVKTLISIDASLVEINPLIVTATGELLAIDAKINIDDSALFRQPDIALLRTPEEETAPERMAREAGISYVKLDGSIGCMVNGAGLAMALLDTIKLHGGTPANFLDVGGGADASQVRRAMDLILEDPAVEVVLVNIFGGITRCDEVARGIVTATANLARKVPLVVRLVGTNEAQGLSILREAGISAHADMIAAVEAAIQQST